MNFTKATRKRCKMKMSLQGPSGAGKTYSALLLAKGITGNLQKVAVIDTENGSSHLYAHLGNYSVLTVQSPFTPEKYIEAIHSSIKEGFECIIIDSLSHEWFGSGGILDVHGSMVGNSFTNWSKLTPRHNALIETIVNSNIHTIATMRTKTEYVIQQVNGKNIPEKLGVKAVQREDSEYEFTISFELNKNYMALISKDRTGIFKNQPELILSEKVGKAIKDWCEFDESTDNKHIKEKLLNCGDLEELDQIISQNPEYADLLRDEISYKIEDLTSINQQKFRQNGHYQH